MPPFITPTQRDGSLFYVHDSSLDQTAEAYQVVPTAGKFEQWTYYPSISEDGVVRCTRAPRPTLFASKIAALGDGRPKDGQTITTRGNARGLGTIFARNIKDQKPADSGFGSVVSRKVGQRELCFMPRWENTWLIDIAISDSDLNSNDSLRTVNVKPPTIAQSYIHSHQASSFDHNGIPISQLYTCAKPTKAFLEESILGASGGHSQVNQADLVSLTAEIEMWQPFTAASHLPEQMSETVRIQVPCVVGRDFKLDTEDMTGSRKVTMTARLVPPDRTEDSVLTEVLALGRSFKFNV